MFKYSIKLKDFWDVWRTVWRTHYGYDFDGNLEEETLYIDFECKAHKSMYCTDGCGFLTEPYVIHINHPHSPETMCTFCGGLTFNECLCYDKEHWLEGNWIHAL